MKRRGFVSLLLGLAAAGLGVVEDAEARIRQKRRRRGRKVAVSRTPGRKRIARKSKTKYRGREVVDFPSREKPGTIIIRTAERALYKILGNGKAMRYLVAVGKEGFAWSGTARVGLKKVNPRWTPPPEMIERNPEYAQWAGGMPGGIPENPLGARALYLFNKRGDTQYRIHGTNAPWSIGTASSSGCIRMLNHEVIELYNGTPIGTKVIVL
jgi:lipoprotein-anchoring transpeptidase ErfK/SrfK